MSGPVYDYPSCGTGIQYCPVCGKEFGVSSYWRNGVRYCSDTCAYAMEDKGVLRKVPVIPDPVLSPSHYTAGGIETIDFIRAKLTPDEFRGFLKGSIIKYLSRANLKGNEEQDYRKASFYASMLAGKDPRGEAE